MVCIANKYLKAIYRVIAIVCITNTYSTNKQTRWPQFRILLQIGVQVAMEDWRGRVSARTGWPGVSMPGLGEIASSTSLP